MNRVRPERRTRLDLIASAIIVVVVVLVGVTVWAISPARSSHDNAASAPMTPVTMASSAPLSLTPAWQFPTGASTSAMVTNAAVVTADGGTVSAHDPTTGNVRWSYHRDLHLCDAVAAFPSRWTVYAAYRNSRGCGEVTALDASTGQRRTARSSDADRSVHLSNASNYVVSAGSSRLESWGSNLVRGVEYGRVSAPVQPGAQTRSNCHIYSAATGSDTIAVIERCPGDSGYRLSIFSAAQDKDGKVSQSGSRVVTSGGSHAPPHVIGVSSQAVAVYAATGTAADPAGPQIQVFGTDASVSSTHDVIGKGTQPLSDSFPHNDNGLVSYFTGAATVVLEPATLTPRYQIPQSLGPATMMGRDLLIPGKTGISVIDPVNGRQIRTLAVDRPEYRDTPITLAAIGNNVIESYGGVAHVLQGR